MQIIDERLLFSPSDLNHFLECEHLIQLERLRRAGFERARDPHAELLAAKGLAHERAWLERSRQDGRQVIEIKAAETGRTMPNERSLRCKLAPSCVIIIKVYSSTTAGLASAISLCGRRQLRRSVDGATRYGTRNSQRQISCISCCSCASTPANFAACRGSIPRYMHVILHPGGAQQISRFADFESYYRSVRNAFAIAVTSGRETYPYPVAHCALWRGRRRVQRWKSDNHLLLWWPAFDATRLRCSSKLAFDSWRNWRRRGTACEWGLAAQRSSA